MGVELLAERLAVERLVVARDRAGIGRWRRGGCAEETTQDPVAALDRAGAEWRGGRGEHYAKTQHAAAVEGVGVLDERHLLGRAEVLFDAVKIRQRLVEKCVVGVEHLAHRAVLTHEIFEGRDGLVIHRRPHVVGELGEAARVHAAILVEAVEAQPLPEKLRREPARLRVGRHAPHLLRQQRGLGQLAGGGGAAQLIVGDGCPQKEAQAARQLPVVERLFRCARDGLHAVEKRRRDQHACEQRLDGVVMAETVLLFGSLVKRPQASRLRRRERPPPSAVGERERVLDVPRLGLCLRPGHGGALGPQPLDMRAHLGGERGEVGCVHVLDMRAFQLNLVVLGEQAEVGVVVGKCIEEVVPRLVQLCAVGGVEQVFRKKLVGALVFHPEHEGVVLRCVEGAVEGGRHGVLVRRVGLAVGVGRQERDVFSHAGAEIFVAGAGGVAEEHAGLTAARGHAGVVVREHEAQDGVAVRAELGVHLEGGGAAGRDGEFQRDGLGGRKIIGPQRAALGAAAKRQFCHRVGLEQRAQGLGGEHWAGGRARPACARFGRPGHRLTRLGRWECQGVSPGNLSFRSAHGSIGRRRPSAAPAARACPASPGGRAADDDLGVAPDDHGLHAGRGVEIVKIDNNTGAATPGRPQPSGSAPAAPPGPRAAARAGERVGVGECWHGLQ